MSSIPQCLNGNKLEHKIAMKGSSDTSMVGIQVFPQTLTLTANLTLSFDDTNTKIYSDHLVLDPSDNNYNVLLPAALSGSADTVDLQGRILKIWNSGASGYVLNLQDSSGNHLAIIGSGDVKEVHFPAHGNPVVKPSISKHVYTLSQAELLDLKDTPVTLMSVPAAAGVIFSSLKAVFSGTTMTQGSDDINVKHNATIVAALANSIVTSAATTLKAAAASLAPALGDDFTISTTTDEPTVGSTDSQLEITLFFQEL